jgi:hypothetical protein
MLFALALRDLVRTAEYAKRFEPERVGAALDHFNGAVPHARAMRNVLEHFDDYESGTGKLQRKRKRGEAGLLRWYENDAERYSLVFVVAGTQLRLDVGAAQEAAEQLAGGILAALHGAPP